MGAGLINEWENQDSWAKRWRSLRGSIQHLRDRVMDLSKADEPFPRAGAFVHLLICLEQFAWLQANYFYQGFSNTSLEPTAVGIDPNNLVPIPDPVGVDDDFPPDHVLSVTLDQISYDLAVIQRAVSQRVLGTRKENETLIKADWLAYKALEPATEVGLIPEGSVAITYFQKEASIRVIPYTKVALIALPFSAVEVSQDYLAIPHEVGHYVFWREMVDEEIPPGEEPWFRKREAPMLRAFLDVQYKRWLPGLSGGNETESAFRGSIYNWTEEIYADVYGCLVAGPVIALSFQDLQLEKEKEIFDKDDGVHPVPLIRPDLYHQVLRMKALEGWTLWAEYLSGIWEARRQQRKNQDSIRFTPKNEFEKFLLKAHADVFGKYGGEIDKAAVKRDSKRFSPLPDEVEFESIEAFLTQAIGNLLGDQFKHIKVKKESGWTWQKYMSKILDPNAITPELPRRKLYEEFDDSLVDFNLIEKLGQLTGKDTALSELANAAVAAANTASVAAITDGAAEIAAAEAAAAAVLVEADKQAVPDDLQQKWHQIGKTKKSNPTWRHVLKADGWATKGPDGRFDPE